MNQKEILDTVAAMMEETVPGSGPLIQEQLEKLDALPTFDTDNMLVMLRSQQGKAFQSGQRISDPIAQLLNGLPEALEALAAYQTGLGVKTYSRFNGGRKVVPTAPAAAPEATPASKPEGARLISGFKINTKTGEKERIEG